MAVHFDSNQFTQIVVSKSEIRMYDILTSKLITVLNNVFKIDQGQRPEITAFKIDKRHRKAYVANNKGEIFVINCQNGVIIKNVTQYIEDLRNIKEYDQGKFNETLTSLGSSKFGDSD